MSSTHLPLDAQFTVAGLIIYSTPQQSEQVVQQLNSLQGVEVHASSPEGKLVITIEELPGQKTMINTINTINDIRGVVSTSLVYTHSDDWREESSSSETA